MITLVYDVLFGYIMFSVFDEVCTQIKESGEPVHSGPGFACLRRLRVRHLEYWHPN